MNAQTVKHTETSKVCDRCEGKGWRVQGLKCAKCGGTGEVGRSGMSKRVDYTTYRRTTETREGHVGKCPKCGRFGLRFFDETIHGATFDRGLMFTFTDRPADRCQIIAGGSA